MLILRATKGHLAGYQNNLIYLNFQFHLQKSLETFEKKSADKIWSNKYIQVKMPCPVPDRVNSNSISAKFN